MLDIEPHGPLPTQIYWRRRALALGIGVLVIAIIAAVVVVRKVRRLCAGMAGLPSWPRVDDYGFPASPVYASLFFHDSDRSWKTVREACALSSMSHPG